MERLRMANMAMTMTMVNDNADADHDEDGGGRPPRRPGRHALLGCLRGCRAEVDLRA